MYKIAIIEDDAPSNDKFLLYVKNLWPESHVDQFLEFAPAIEAITNNEYDVVISDIDLGSGTDEYGGVKIARALDARRIPLLIVSGSVQPEIQRGIFRALDAWDYLQKPVSEGDFALQLERAMKFRKAQTQPITSTSGEAFSTNDPDLIINFRSPNIVTWKNRKVSVSMTQIKLLELLVSKANSSVTFEEFYPLISSGRNKDNLRVHLNKIRNALIDVDEPFDKIRTITMVGYSWRV